MKAADVDEGKYLGSEAAIMTITKRPNMTRTAPRAAHVTDVGHLTFPSATIALWSYNKKRRAQVETGAK